MALYSETAHELHDKLVKKEISSVELTKAVYDRIDEVEDQVKAYITLDKENALAQAAKVDKMIADGETIKPLAGIPGAIKDNISVKGVRMTCASKILENFVPVYDAHVIENLRKDETIFLGKTNMDEFAMGVHHGNLSFPDYPQPLGSVPCTGRFFRRQRSQHCSRGSHLVPGLRYRRFHPAAGFLQRLCGAETHLRPGLPVRLRGVRLLPGSGGAHCP